jgi:hypothetical protein
MPIDGYSTISFPRNVDGIDTLLCDDGIFEDDVLIKGDLVVLGTITDSGGGPPVTFLSLTVQNNYNGPTAINTINTDATSGSLTVHSFQNDTANKLNIQLNSSSRLLDGGPSAASIINTGGKLILGSSGGSIELSTSLISPLVVSVTNTTQSTNTNTGSIITDGGVGIAKRLNVGEELVARQVESTFNNDGPSVLKVTNSNNTSSAFSQLSIDNNSGGAVLFLNSGTKSSDGGVNTFTLRNNVGQVRLLGSGGGQLNLSTNVNTPSILQVTNSTASTNATSGAIQVTGGVGIQGNLFVGGTINGSIIFTTTPTFTVSNLTGTTFSVLSTTNTSSPITGSAVFTGGVGIAKDLQVGESVIAKSISEIDNFDGDTSLGIINTTAGTSAQVGLTITNNTGTGQVFLNSSTKTSDGGVNTLSVKNNVGNVRIISSGAASLILTTLVTTPSQVSISNATASTSSLTGALVVTGGLGVGGAIRGAGAITGTSINTISILNAEALSTVSNTSTGTSALSNFRLTNSAGNCSLFLNSTTRVAEGGGSAATLRNDVGLLRLLTTGSNGITIANTTGDCSFSSTTQSTSGTTGGINTLGGAGITRDLFVGGNATITGTLTAGAATTFTPTYVTGGSITYSSQQGHHYRLGRLAIITINITTTSAIDLSATNLRVNLPFTNNNPGRMLGSVLFDHFGIPISTDTISAIVEPASNVCTFLCTRDLLGWQLVLSPTTAATRSISISITLFV